MNNNEVITYSNDQKENEKSRKKQEFQEYIAKLKLERKKKIEEEKEKKKQKQLKQIEIQNKQKKKEQKVLNKLEKEKGKINIVLIKIFDDITLFQEYVKIQNHYNSENVLYLFKRVLYELPNDFNISNLNKLRKNMFLYEIGYDKEEEYNDILKLLEKMLFNKEIINFKKQLELYQMYNSLIDTIDDKEYIVNKVFDMYKNFYASTFSKNVTKTELKEIIQNINRQKEYKEYRENFFNRNNDVILKIPYIDNNSLNRFIKLIEKTTYFKGINNLDIDIFSYTINSLTYKVSEKEKNFILENVYKIFNKLNKDLEKQKLIKEKERLLKGDMSKEVEMRKQAVEYSNVQNGYEFEEYVANLYRKLGYTIEEVTKKSGDQGADIIAYKDNNKYVIQVKFYNNPVGNKAVQEVVGAIGMYKANRGIVVTNSNFTPSAVELANANEIELVDGQKIEKYKKLIIDKI